MIRSKRIITKIAVMTFFEALYGSQYYEIQQKGKDGNKGRLNANLFFTALIILCLIAILMASIYFTPGFSENMNSMVRSVFKVSDGKSIGILLGIPLMAIIYLIVSSTIGNEKRFTQKVEAFMQYPEEIKKKANTKLLTPFFILLIFVTVLGFLS